MAEDVASFGHDIAKVLVMRPPDAKTPYHRSAARPLLEKDVAEGKHKQMKPKELYQTRPEYQMDFTLEEFRKHVYQEADAIPKRKARWEANKKKWLYPEVHKNHPYHKIFG